MATPTVAILPPPPPPPEVVGNESVNEQQQQQSPSLLYTDNHHHVSSSVGGGSSGGGGMMDAISFASGGGGGASSSITSVATMSSPWQYDDHYPVCTLCHVEFTPIMNRRHHCRLCGKIFCHACSSQKSLIPPSSIVLVPSAGKKCKPRNLHSTLEDDGGGGSSSGISFTPEPDPDRMLTYLSGSSTAGGSSSSNNNGDYYCTNNELLYGKGLEERFKLAREPLRVCRSCHVTLQPLQDDLRASNSNAMRFNHVDPTDARRLFNSPIAHTLGHEIRKAAYTLNNLLPMPKRMGAMMMIMTMSSTAPYSNSNNNNNNALAQSCSQQESMHCKESCSALSPNLGALDGVRIPARLLEQARGIAILTVLKGGFGLAGAEFGTGLVVARTDVVQQQHYIHGGQGPHQQQQNMQQQQQRTWSAPSAIGTCGLSWGALVGAQVSDHVFLLMTDDAVQMLFSDTGSVQLGADVGVALGPLGRAVEGNVGASTSATTNSGTGGGTAAAHVAPIYTYSLSKGFYAGISLDGKVIRTRHAVNERFYGRQVSAREILNGEIPLPPAAQPLYEALARCHVYAASATASSLAASSLAQRNNTSQQQQQYDQQQPFGSYPQMIQPTFSAMAPPITMQQQQQQQHHKLLDPAILEQEDSGLVGEYGEMPNHQRTYNNDDSNPMTMSAFQGSYSDSNNNNNIPTTSAVATPTMATLPPSPPQADDAYPGDAHSQAGGMSEITLDPGY